MSGNRSRQPVGAQLHGNPVYLAPAITFALVDFIVPLALAVEIGHRAGTPEPAPELASAHWARP